MDTKDKRKRCSLMSDRIFLIEFLISSQCRLFRPGWQWDMFTLFTMLRVMTTHFNSLGTPPRCIPGTRPEFPYLVTSLRIRSAGAILVQYTYSECGNVHWGNLFKLHMKSRQFKHYASSEKVSLKLFRCSEIEKYTDAFINLRKML